MATEPLLQVRDLCVDYLDASGGVRAVEGLGFDVREGEVLGLAGESGSGKSTAAQAILRVLRPPGVIRRGQVLFEGEDVLRMDEAALRRWRWRRASMVFQAAMDSLNPVLTVGEQIADTLRAHGQANRAAIRARSRELFEVVEIDPARLEAYPHELSGGMRQRVVIALALALEPRLLVMDEPTTALDVMVEAGIFRRLLELKERLRFAVLLITHDLRRMLEVADRVGVLYAGRLVEIGPAAAIAAGGAHPYTQGLLGSSLSVVGAKVRTEGIPGVPPSLRNPPSGCRFHPRCARACERCSAEVPALEALAENHAVACIRR